MGAGGWVRERMCACAYFCVYAAMIVEGQMVLDTRRTCRVAAGRLRADGHPERHRRLLLAVVLVPLRLRHPGWPRRPRCPRAEGPPSPPAVLYRAGPDCGCGEGRVRGFLRAE